MKKIVNVATPAVCAVALVLSVAAITKTNAATAPAPIVTSVPAPAGQPVDLTYAAEKALPSVVYIKSVQNSKIQTVEYSDPFEEFFSNPFGGFFGQGQGNNGRRQRQVQTPKRAAAGSGVRGHKGQCPGKKRGGKERRVPCLLKAGSESSGDPWW